MRSFSRVVFIYAETAMHAGTGTGLGAVDLPIQREKHTDFPMIQSSGVKGALRNAAELKLSDADAELIFGATPDKGDNDGFAGAVSPSDARILCFPVRALNGVFVWLTCPSVLARFQQDMRLDAVQIPMPQAEQALVSSPNLLLNGNSIVLEEYAYKATSNELVAEWAGYLASQTLPQEYSFWRERLQSHLVVLHDDDFRDFVKYATEIVTRIKINPQSKVVDKENGALFTQELLPADSILYSIVEFSHSRNPDHETKGRWEAQKVYEKLREYVQTSIQIGADETVGRGRVRLTWQEVNND
jgi:CRISPR-associated protein Cmr4